MKVDLTVLAIPVFFGSMGAEYAWQRSHPVEPGTRAGDYQLADTLASLSMGVGSLVAPYVAKKLLDPVTPGVGRYGKAFLATGLAAAVATTVGDVVRRRLRDGRLPDAQTLPDDVRRVQDELAELRQAKATPRDQRPPRPRPALTKAHGALAASAVLSTALTTSTVWAAHTTGRRLFGRGIHDLGTGKVAWATAILGWDFIYYWNHRLDHESRWLWAMHVAHHSSERYNLSTALRQPVAESLVLSVPYGLLALLGVRPELIEQARGINLLYQFWIHTEAIDHLPAPAEKVLNTPSHHRVHHGANEQYLDKNYGGILIVWDKLFGTFEPEVRRIKYGLTKNINTFNPIKVGYHEFVDIARDVRRSGSVREGLRAVFGPPGWTPRKGPEQLAA